MATFQSNFSGFHLVAIYSLQGIIVTLEENLETRIIFL